MKQDSVLVDRVKDGQTSAYEQLVARYQRAATVVALRVLRDYQRAEDVVQESFVTAYEHLDSLRDGSKFGPWLMRITRRRAARAARREKSTVSIGSVPEPTDPARAPQLRDGQERLVQLINRLPIHERLVVTLCHLDGRPASEVAQATGRPVGTVTKQLSRAMRRLRRWLHAEERPS